MAGNSDVVQLLQYNFLPTAVTPVSGSTAILHLHDLQSNTFLPETRKCKNRLGLNSAQVVMCLAYKIELIEVLQHRSSVHFNSETQESNWINF